MFHSIINRSSNLAVDELKIRLIASKDAERITAYYQKNRAYLQPWEPLREEHFYTLAGWEKRLIQLTELQKHHLAYYFVVQQQGSDEICGVVNFSNLVKHPFHACHVGYSLGEAFQGQGIMRRAVDATVQWIFEDRNFHRVMAAYMPRNERSEKVLQSVGFEREGYAKDYLLINGHWEDHVLTSKRNPNWKPV
ncbi:ribosomal-protein-alanine acetyltransferase [Photobacterium jeanii]|uniref:Ribosomal-protein-alanine acetyltransferase n=1 Tax=Photobacterium jeanii TaxID=858640 RepID=A0A178KM01_9GAMM|nr:ribosomal protein S5-alanine N-acetyltransferase [Photobacterium jeanii]OAN18281.1 ribosomal-protein-alanine acetyltransferase [Photobacterium jeanii]PST92040.1 30S ribosomal protein S5 alanine N-acetyltransferase [Photobacterium jeanii]